MASMYDLKIFRLNRIRYEYMWEDAIKWIKRTYKNIGAEFTVASPFYQLLQVILHLGRMIFYYIEDSITGLNIRTAYRPDQIKGLATLTGHDASRTISSRAGIRIVYYEHGDMEYSGKVCYIPNKIKIISKLNGCTYTIMFSADAGRITMQPNNYIEATIIQGTVKIQQGTSTGLPLQSFNFTERNYAEIEQYYINVYVNGEPWDIVDSLIDLGYNQKGCIVKTGMTGGIDVFFGNGTMGRIPRRGETIRVEYIVSDGPLANIPKDDVNTTDAWQFDDTGYLFDGTPVDLNSNFHIQCTTDILFGTYSEDITLTQMIAPHASRSFVLANELNYKYFFKRMNMFSTIEVIRGRTTKQTTELLQLAYTQAAQNYDTAAQEYHDILSMYGEKSQQTKNAYDKMSMALTTKNYANQKITDNAYNDNTIYIMLIPDISKRISSNANYFTCDESLFTLSEDEQYNLLNLIEVSGQRVITVENKIVSPKIARFSINVSAKLWNEYNEDSIYANIFNKLSDYLIKFDRKDILPLSDIIALFENVKGIDSVKVWFDADKNNQDIYGRPGFYGIDDYGDIVLTRKIIDGSGQPKVISDILPLIRGGFVSPDGIEYTAEQTRNGLSAFNFTVSGRTVNRKQTLETYTALT